MRMSSCDQKYNTVRMRNDPYLKSTRFSLATSNHLDGPRKAFPYSMDTRVLKVDFLREIQDGKISKDEILLTFELFATDADIDQRIFFFVNELSYEVPVTNIQMGDKTVLGSSTSTQHGYYTDAYGRGQSGPHQVTNTYSHSFRIARVTIQPDPGMQELLKGATSFGIRAYAGVDALTSFFGKNEVGAVARLYSSQYDKEVKD